MISPVQAKVQSHLISSYRAKYEVMWGHTLIGHATYTLKKMPQHYDFQSTATLSLLFFKYHTQEQSEGQFLTTSRTIVPLHYQLVRDQNGSQKIFSIDFNWEKKLARSEIQLGKKQDVSETELSTGIQDKLSLILQFSQIYQPEQAEYGFSVLDGDHIKTYHVSVQGKETIHTKMGDFQTLKLSSQRHGKTFTIWLDVENLARPIQVQENLKFRSLGLSRLVYLEQGEEDAPPDSAQW